MPRAKLVIKQSGKEPRQTEVPGGRVTVGRAPDNVVSLAGDTDVSRYHAIIESRGEEFWVVDLRSSNGTTVNGETVAPDRKLKDGDLI
ncbi:MAG TPA: FHA domain-containing protein, partial [Pyrinomonadaceae bacterium]